MKEKEKTFLYKFWAAVLLLLILLWILVFLGGLWMDAGRPRRDKSMHQTIDSLKQLKEHDDITDTDTLMLDPALVDHSEIKDTVNQ